jgi:hypothetical protein
VTDRRNFQGIALIRTLRSLRKNGHAVIIPEVDRVLPLITLALVLRCLPQPTVVIVMRPPYWTGVRAVLQSTTKTVMIAMLTSARRTVDVLLLEDPLAKGAERVWQRPFANPRMRLDDPTDLIPSDEQEQPPELATLPPQASVIALVGSIDGRKQVPMILRGWLTRPALEHEVLVIAGRQAAEVREQIATVDWASRADVVVIDRYLSNGEIAWIFERATGVLALNDGGISSGISSAAARHSKWVITEKGSRTGRVASARGFGVEAKLDPSSLADAMVEVVRSNPPHELHGLPTRADFGARVVREPLRSGR